MSQEINRPGLNQILTRTLGIKGNRAPAGLLTPEIMPAIVLENDRYEYHALGGSQLMAAYQLFDQTLQADMLLATLEPPPGTMCILEFAQVTIEFVGGPARACVSGFINSLGTQVVTQNTMNQGFCDGRLGGSHSAVEANIFDPAAFAGGVRIDHENIGTLNAGGDSASCVLFRKYPAICRGAVPNAVGAPYNVRQQCGVLIEVGAAAVDEIEITMNFRIRPFELEELERTR